MHKDPTEVTATVSWCKEYCLASAIMDVCTLTLSYYAWVRHKIQKQWQNRFPEVQSNCPVKGILNTIVNLYQNLYDLIRTFYFYMGKDLLTRSTWRMTSPIVVPAVRHPISSWWATIYTKHIWQIILTWTSVKRRPAYLWWSNAFICVSMSLLPKKESRRGCLATHWEPYERRPPEHSHGSLQMATTASLSIWGHTH